MPIFERKGAKTQRDGAATKRKGLQRRDAEDAEIFNAEMERQAVVVRHLLQVRLGEELHRRSIKMSAIAIVVSFVAVGFAGLQTLESRRNVHLATPPPVFEKSQVLLPPVKSLSPDKKAIPATTTNASPTPALISPPTPAKK